MLEHRPELVCINNFTPTYYSRRESQKQADNELPENILTIKSVRGLGI